MRNNHGNRSSMRFVFRRTWNLQTTHTQKTIQIAQIYLHNYVHMCIVCAVRNWTISQRCHAYILIKRALNNVRELLTYYFVNCIKIFHLLGVWCTLFCWVNFSCIALPWLAVCMVAGSVNFVFAVHKLCTCSIWSAHLQSTAYRFDD